MIGEELNLVVAAKLNDGSCKNFEDFLLVLSVSSYETKKARLRYVSVQLCLGFKGFSLLTFRQWRTLIRCHALRLSQPFPDHELEHRAIRLLRLSFVMNNRRNFVQSPEA